ncbi:ribonuclease HI, partial [Lecanoromycetidae sp. Uapishka_2]
MDDTASIKSTSSNGTKRKRENQEKFYAVRVGHLPGVYRQWKECLEQVKGFKNATFKSFSTLTDAELFVAGENPTQTGADGLPSPAKFYAVKSGKVPGIYLDWPSAQIQVLGWQGPKHRSFLTRAEAQKYMDEDDSQRKESPKAAEADDLHSITYHISGGPVEANADPPARKKTKKNNTIGPKVAAAQYNEADYEPGTAPLPPDAEDGFDPNVVFDSEVGKIVYKTQEQRQATKLMPSRDSQTEPIRIYTDGSSLGNGTAGAFAGVGVYFGPNNPLNVSETLPGTRHTNQRAELSAILRALEIAPRNRDVVIITDSKYAIDCVTNWFMGWRKNNWKTAAGKAVENRDIVENVLSKIEEREKLRARTKFEWIKGHANQPGNVEADRLAVDGARKGPGTS